MIEEQKSVELWMQKAGQATPTNPTMPENDVRILRIKLITEELIELADALGVEIQVNNSESTVQTKNTLENKHQNLIDAYDGICDLLVVVLGTAVALGCKAKPGFDEVMTNNNAKFGPGSYRREDGKWIKPPNLKKPDLARILYPQTDEP